MKVVAATPRPRPTPVAGAAGAAGVILQGGLAFAVAEMHHSDVVAQNAEGWLPALAFASMVAAPAVLALIGLVSSRAILLIAATAACGPLVAVSFILAGAWIPALLFAAAGCSMLRAERSTGVPGIIAITSPWLGFVVALAVLVSARGSYEGQGYGGDYYLPSRAAIAIGVLLVAVVTAVVAGLRTPRG